jgi:hypothetical protein
MKFALMIDGTNGVIFPLLLKPADGGMADAATEGSQPRKPIGPEV